MKIFDYVRVILYIYYVIKLILKVLLVIFFYVVLRFKFLR